MYEKDYLKTILRRFLEVYQERTAFFLYQEQAVCSISYRQFGEDILKAAGYLAEHKIADAHIALAAENSYGWYVIFFAALASGNTAVLLNQNLAPEELLEQCAFADVSHVFCDKTREALFAGTPYARLPWEAVSHGKGLPLERVCCPEEKALSCLLFTSGTLGTTKAVMLSAGNMQMCMSDRMDKFQVRKTLLVLPLYHIGGIGGTSYLLAGGKTVCIGRGVKYIFQDLPLMNPNHIFMVPGIMNTLVKILKKYPDAREREKYIGTELHCLGVGGAASEEAVCGYLIEQGFALSTGYGMSETAGYGMMGLMTKERLNSVGTLIEGMECRLEEGEILLAGDPVMLGYYKDPEGTRQVLQDGWLHTGDLGYRDADGWYYLTGRKKNVIILANGENVSPEQLEETLYKCEAVLECLVYSVPQGICADIYTRNPSQAEAFVKEYNWSVPTYRQIHQVNYYDTPLEKTMSGKIKRKENRYE